MRTILSVLDRHAAAIVAYKEQATLWLVVQIVEPLKLKTNGTTDSSLPAAIAYDVPVHPGTRDQVMVIPSMHSKLTGW